MFPIDSLCVLTQPMTYDSTVKAHSDIRIPLRKPMRCVVLRRPPIALTPFRPGPLTVGRPHVASPPIIGAVDDSSHHAGYVWLFGAAVAGGIVLATHPHHHTPHPPAVPPVGPLPVDTTHGPPATPPDTTHPPTPPDTTPKPPTDTTTVTPPDSTPSTPIDTVPTIPGDTAPTPPPIDSVPHPPCCTTPVDTLPHTPPTTPVPEPSPFVLVIGGVATLGAIHYRRSRRNG